MTSIFDINNEELCKKKKIINTNQVEEEWSWISLKGHFGQLYYVTKTVGCLEIIFK